MYEKSGISLPVMVWVIEVIII